MRLRITPDGIRYRALANGAPVPRPFTLRWLLPWLCRLSDRRWRAASILGALLAVVGTGFLAPDWRTGLAAGLLVLALPGIRLNLRFPVLVDLPALGLAVCAAAAWHHGLWWVAVPLVLVAGCCKETAPVFAALYAWHPALLVGAVAPLARALVARPGPDVVAPHYPRNPEVVALCAASLAHPFRTGWTIHKPLLLSPVMAVPWGAALAGLAALDWQLAAVLTVAYAQLLVATDTVRLYQWAAPVLCVAAATVVPAVWLPVLVVITVWNPVAGDGV